MWCSAAVVLGVICPVKPAINSFYRWHQFRFVNLRHESHHGHAVAESVAHSQPDMRVCVCVLAALSHSCHCTGDASFGCHISVVTIITVKLSVTESVSVWTLTPFLGKVDKKKNAVSGVSPHAQAVNRANEFTMSSDINSLRFVLHNWSQLNNVAWNHYYRLLIMDDRLLVLPVMESSCKHIWLIPCWG